MEIGTGLFEQSKEIIEPVSDVEFLRFSGRHSEADKLEKKAFRIFIEGTRKALEEVPRREQTRKINEEIKKLKKFKLINSAKIEIIKKEVRDSSAIELIKVIRQKVDPTTDQGKLELIRIEEALKELKTRGLITLGGLTLGGLIGALLLGGAIGVNIAMTKGDEQTREIKDSGNSKRTESNNKIVNNNI